MLKTLQDLFLVFTSVLFIVDPLTAVPTFLVRDRRGDAHPHPAHGGTLARAVPGWRHRHVEPGRYAVGAAQPRRLEAFERLRHDHLGPEAVPPRGLGAVQQAVRRADRRLQALRRLQTGHHAAAHRERQVGLVRQRLQRLLQLLDRGAGGLGAGLREQQRELVAAQPGHDVAGTHGAARCAGDQPQHFVAHLVWEQAAHFPEVVEVEVRDRERMRVAARALELPARELVKGAPVFEPRQAAGGTPLEPSAGKRNLIDLIVTVAYGIGADRHPVSLGELHAAYLRAYPGVGKGASRASFDATVNYHCINMRSRFPDARNPHKPAYWLARPIFKRVARARYMLLSEEE